MVLVKTSGSLAFVSSIPESGSAGKSSTLIQWQTLRSKRKGESELIQNVPKVWKAECEQCNHKGLNKGFHLKYQESYQL